MLGMAYVVRSLFNQRVKKIIVDFLLHLCDIDFGNQQYGRTYLSRCKAALQRREADRPL